MWIVTELAIKMFSDSYNYALTLNCCFSYFWIDAVLISSDFLMPSIQVSLDAIIMSKVDAMQSIIYGSRKGISQAKLF